MKFNGGQLNTAHWGEVEQIICVYFQIILHLDVN